MTINPVDEGRDVAGHAVQLAAVRVARFRECVRLQVESQQHAPVLAVTGARAQLLQHSFQPRDAGDIDIQRFQAGLQRMRMGVNETGENVPIGADVRVGRNALDVLTTHYEFARNRRPAGLRNDATGQRHDATTDRLSRATISTWNVCGNMSTGSTSCVA